MWSFSEFVLLFQTFRTNLLIVTCFSSTALIRPADSDCILWYCVFAALEQYCSGLVCVIDSIPSLFDLLNRKCISVRLYMAFFIELLTDIRAAYLLSISLSVSFEFEDIVTPQMYLLKVLINICKKKNVKRVFKYC